MKYSVDVNITVDVPDAEVEALENDAETDGTGFEYVLMEYLETNLDVTYLFGDAWVCSVDKAESIGG